MSGREYSIDEVMREIEKETVFMDRSEGGVTFCGGEPLSRPSDLIALLDRCGALGIHRAVDTTLFASPDTVRSVMERTDLFLVDLWIPVAIVVSRVSRTSVSSPIFG